MSFHLARRFALLLFFFFFTLFSPLSFAEREQVLKQIDLPHHYYYREMYLPQLTTGPGSAAWSPDSEWLVYAMQGSLWKQKMGTTVAEQLTEGPGYHYQPDWSPDGKWIIFAEYYKDAVELMLLEVASGKISQVTDGRAVNVEPHWTPDSKRIAFVSTSHNKRFHIFTADFTDGHFSNFQRLTSETESKPRYYYSKYDHEISPTWSPDGKEIIFIHNHERIYGTGGLYRMRAEAGAEMKEIHYEETTWKARPHWSPDGKRVVFASYQGRQWHQLWLVPAAGGDPLPMTFGEYDNVSPRWSPDGKYIVFISNRDGNTSLWVLETIGGSQIQVIAKERKYKIAVGKIHITVLDETGKTTPARVTVKAADGREYAPDDAWMHSDDGFDRADRSFEAHYFHCTGRSTVTVPAGKVVVEVMKGFEHHFEKRSLEVKPNQTVELSIQTNLLDVPKEPNVRWASSDLHIHMNYGGAYRNDPKHLLLQAQAEDLNFSQNLIVNKEQRIPDIQYFSGKLDPVSTGDYLLMHGQEYHTSYWGHMGLLHLTRNFLMPAFAAYPNTSSASLYPDNTTIAKLAHDQGALVGYVHPFDKGDTPDPAHDAKVTYALPVDVALGNVDYLEVLGFSDHNTTADVWYRLLNLGFRIPAAAGTDAMANYASVHGPVGLFRVYARVPTGPIMPETWLQSLTGGHTFATNGPLLGLTIEGKGPGDEVKSPSAKTKLKYQAWMRSLVPVGHVDLVCNGKVEKEFEMTGEHDVLDTEGTVELGQSGWCLLRAHSEKSQQPILDYYPYATTSAVYITVAGEPARSLQDAAYFAAWVGRMIEAATTNQDWNSEDEKKIVLKHLTDAKTIYQKMK